MIVGLDISTSAEPDADPVRDAIAAEELGFDYVSASDHLHGALPTYETWTMLAWIAASTSRITVTTRVLGLPYRNPAVVAKMAESLHRLSGGRLVLGLGGGASDEEFRGFGLGCWRPGDKVGGLEEAVRIIRGMWSQPSFTFGGRLFSTDGAELEPKPDGTIRGAGVAVLTLLDQGCAGHLPGPAHSRTGPLSSSRLRARSGWGKKHIRTRPESPVHTVAWGVPRGMSTTSPVATGALRSPSQTRPVPAAT